MHDYDVSFLHRGVPELGFRLCLRAAMDAMPDMRVKAQPQILGPPQRLRINFEMAGSWAGEVVLIARGHPTVAVPIQLVVDEQTGKPGGPRRRS